MARQQVGTLTFEGTLHVERSRSTMAGRDRLAVTELGGDVGYCVHMTREKPSKGRPSFQELWLLAPQLAFQGAVTVDGPPSDFALWRVGLIQTITHSERVGYYTGPLVRRQRLDTSFGPLKDGQKDSLFYVSADAFAPLSANQGMATVWETDAPNFALPTSYSGNPATPHNPTGTAALGELQRTGGEDFFESYLAAVCEGTKSVVVLAKSSWRVSWQGTYDCERTTWRPADEQLVTVHNESDFGHVYADLGHNRHVVPPFSLFLAEAEEACQINAPGGWVACSLGSGEPRKDGARILDRWTG
jgi:hypothetical protein